MLRAIIGPGKYAHARCGGVIAQHRIFRHVARHRNADIAGIEGFVRGDFRHLRALGQRHRVSRSETVRQCIHRANNIVGGAAQGKGLRALGRELAAFSGIGEEGDRCLGAGDQQEVAIGQFRHRLAAQIAQAFR